MRDPGPGGGSSTADAETYTGQVEDACEAMEKGIDEAFKRLKKIITKINEHAQYAGPVTAGVTMVNPGAGLLTPAALQWIYDNLDKIEKAVKRLKKRVEHALKHQVPVVSLIYTSFAWLDGVKGPTSTLRGPAAEPADRNIQSWDADAQKEYARIQGEQTDALKAAFEHASFVSEWLMKIALANVAYMNKLAKIVAELVAELGVAIAEIASVVEAPWGLDRAAGVIGKLVSGGVAALGDIVEKLVSAIADVRELYSKRIDESVFRDGEWPEAVTL